MSKKRLPVQSEKCATCPFKEGSKLAGLACDLAESALTDKSRICHSTGSNNAINRRTGKPPMLCRGARDIQLTVFHAFGVIDAATDEAWEKKCTQLKI
jgi:hypothetical protein